jgi:LacI family transcriptional regulator, galactose operon repressor
MKPQRVLIVLGTEGAWSRGILRGFIAAARERDWALCHCHPADDLESLLREQPPVAAVFGPELRGDAVARLAPATLVSVTVDRSADGIASVCLDEENIAKLALEHLLAAGLRHVTTFRYDESSFAVARERAFIERARAARVQIAGGWGGEDFSPAQRRESATGMTAWLRALPKACGIFTCTDGWARPVARYAREAGLRVPEDLALIGADNDELECELLSPPLSSVVIPWEDVGRSAAKLVRAALANEPIAGRRAVVSPIAVAARRSSDVLSIRDSFVASAVVWIRDHAHGQLTVAMVARAVGLSRQALDRRFRQALGRTIQEEVQLASADAAGRPRVSHVDSRELAKPGDFLH